MSNFRIDICSPPSDIQGHMKGFVTKTSIKADSQGNVPTTINLLKAGSWNTVWHGDFELTGTDLEEMVANFDEGVGLVEEDNKQAPVNYGHAMGDKAAGWMKRLYTQAVNGTIGLFADVEWTPAAEQAIKDGEWKYLSPEFNPRGFPWEDPEQEFAFVDNVLTGAALTNIPLFKKLKPITASRIPTKRVKADAQGGGDKQDKGDSMKLEDIRAKQVADLTEEEKTFLSEHKAELTDEERKTFGLEEGTTETTETTEATETTEQTEDTTDTTQTNVQASAITGITDEEIAQLRADAQAGREAKAELERKKAEEFVQARISAGQIKSGEKDNTVKVLLASKGEQRTALETLLAGLPKNEQLGKEVGDVGQQVSVEASTELDKRVRKIMADARAAGNTIAYSAARKQVLDADATLKQQLEEEEQ
ncbi:phage protease [Rhodococcus rhodochrous]|uniref:phage protease n=1 Tax=Rhodococcus rhodochrous TaxID=1829 RepID=UPI00177AEADB|nr:phage protease [Rhodococcus rhodochrous]